MMKKIIHLAVAITAFTACNITEIEETTLSKSEEIPFEKGQMVTLTVNAGVNTKVTSELNASDGIDFKWEAGDVIKVTVGGSSAAFTVSKLISGGTSAEFTGTMPGSGSTFDAQFPFDTPTLSNQEYVQNGVPHNKVLACKTGCKLGTPFTLDPQSAAIRFNFYGYDRKVKSITLTNTTADPNVTYILNCTNAVRVPKTESDAKPFIMVIPTGKYAFKVTVTTEEVSPNEDNVTRYVDENGNDFGLGTVVTLGNFQTASANSFTAGTVSNMSVQCISAIWAPVNCGTETNHPYGKLYQYGRKVGCGYNDGSYFMEPQIQDYDNTTTDVSQMTDNSKFYANWRATEWSDSNDPCPIGWRVPTLMELNRLLGGTQVTYAAISPSGYVNYGHWFNGTSTPNKFKTGSSTEYEGLHLIAAGGRSCVNGSAFERATGGYYWASTPYTSDESFGIGFYSTMANAAYNNKAHAFSVRCVYAGE